MDTQRKGKGLDSWKVEVLRRRETHPKETYADLAKYIREKYGIDRERQAYLRFLNKLGKGKNIKRSEGLRLPRDDRRRGYHQRKARQERKAPAQRCHDNPSVLTDRTEPQDPSSSPNEPQASSSPELVLLQNEMSEPRVISSLWVPPTVRKALGVSANELKKLAPYMSVQVVGVPLSNDSESSAGRKSYTFTLPANRSHLATPPRIPQNGADTLSVADLNELDREISELLAESTLLQSQLNDVNQSKQVVVRSPSLTVAEATMNQQGPKFVTFSYCANVQPGSMGPHLPADPTPTYRLANFSSLRRRFLNHPVPIRNKTFKPEDLSWLAVSDYGVVVRTDRILTHISRKTQNQYIRHEIEVYCQLYHASCQTNGSLGEATLSILCTMFAELRDWHCIPFDFLNALHTLTSYLSYMHPLTILITVTKAWEISLTGALDESWALLAPYAKPIIEVISSGWQTDILVRASITICHLLALRDQTDDSLAFLRILFKVIRDKVDPGTQPFAYCMMWIGWLFSVLDKPDESLEALKLARASGERAMKVDHLYMSWMTFLEILFVLKQSPENEARSVVRNNEKTLQRLKIEFESKKGAATDTDRLLAILKEPPSQSDEAVVNEVVDDVVPSVEDA